MDIDIDIAINMVIVLDKDMIPARGPQTKFSCDYASVGKSKQVLTMTVLGTGPNLLWDVHLKALAAGLRYLRFARYPGGDGKSCAKHLSKQVLASGLLTLKQSENSQAQAMFGEYRCVVLT